MTELEWTSLGLDELEALRLADAEGLSQKDGADRMGISQSTFNRILCEARRKVAHSLVNGFAVKIEKTESVRLGRRAERTGRRTPRRHRVRGRGEER